MILVRHTSVAALPGLCYGRTDVPLASTFAEDAAKVRAALGVVPRLAFASPSIRCRQLAEVLGAPAVRVDPRLMELDFGAWENRRWDDLPRAEVDAWANDFVETAPPGGETFRALAERVASFRREHEATDGVVITHGGVIRAWLCQVEGHPLREAFARRVDCGECISIPIP
jgi:alpha-ribazole phosphatase